jgi:outer membrane immunogenic protein
LTAVLEQALPPRDASVRARLGLAFDRILVYATGGGGYVHGKANSEGPGQATLSQFGGVVGGGVEFAFNDHLTLRAEALDYLVDKTATLFIDNATIKDVWVARAGVNYKF